MIARASRGTFEPNKFHDERACWPSGRREFRNVSAATNSFRALIFCLNSSAIGSHRTHKYALQYTESFAGGTSPNQDTFVIFWSQQEALYFVLTSTAQYLIMITTHIQDNSIF